MFTGIIEEKGKIIGLFPIENGQKMEIKAEKVLEDMVLGASIAVNGCCLTCTGLTKESFTVDVVPETLRCTYFATLQPGDEVNLERPVKLNGRLDGHLVQGHIDGLGTVIEKKQLADESWHISISTPPSLMRYIVTKGSIAVDGVSLTVKDVEEEKFSFAMIPFTSRHTTLSHMEEGAKVNLEVDLLAKYIEKLTRI